VRIIIRADASITIGSGHIMRCLTLAEELQNRGDEVHFVCRELHGHLGDLIKEKKIQLSLLPTPDEKRNPADNSALVQLTGVSQKQDAEETIKAIGDSRIDWLIVDHYGIDAQWHGKLRNSSKKILVIDDLANRMLDCDLLLDQTYGREESDYFQFLPRYCKKLMGSQYALLRPQFSQLRQDAMEKRKKLTCVSKILVSMGGMDPDNISSIVIDGLSKVNWLNLVEVDVVLGEKAPYFGSLRSKPETQGIKFNFLSNVSNMAELMLDADIAIGAGGTTTWERCCLGLPALLTINAENQSTIIKNLSTSGAILNLGWHFDLTPIKISSLIEKLLKSIKSIKQMSDKCFHVCDGAGVKRVASNLI